MTETASDTDVTQEPTAESTGPADDNLAQIVAAALAAERHIIRCGCGFFAISDSQVDNRRALEEHPCPLNPLMGGGDASESVEAPTPWYGYVFSMWGALIAGIIVYGLIVILTRGKVT